MLLICCFLSFFYPFSDEDSINDSTSVQILNAAKEALLQGLSEENQGLQSAPAISRLFYICHMLSLI